MLKFRLTPWQLSPIEPVECTSSTSDTVTFVEIRSGHRLEVRHKRKMAQFSYHDTWEQAHAVLLESAARKLEVAQRNAFDAKWYFAKVKAMRPQTNT